ncbi:Potassium transporter 7 [Bienertia sinuspersici]
MKHLPLKFNPSFQSHFCPNFLRSLNYANFLGFSVIVEVIVVNQSPMADEDGEERSSLTSLVKTDSMDSRWVYDLHDESEIEDDEDDDGGDDDSQSKIGIDSDDEDVVTHRLIRTGPRVDSFDVEALEVPGTHRHDFEEFGPLRNVVLIFQMLAVVFGDVGTSQLYTFSVMFEKAPIKGKEDVLGAMSLVDLLLLANSCCISSPMLSQASLHAKVSLIPNQLPSDARISSFRLKVPSPELERSLKIKERLENSLGLKKLLLMLVLAGTSMVIADGVVTPAMSVMSAVDGLRVGISGIKHEQVLMVAVALLIVLFSVQRYGTSKMGFIVGPALFIWFCCLAGLGIYNVLKYDRDVWKAFNPIHIYYYFKRNKFEAWYALGGVFYV